MIDRTIAPALDRFPDLTLPPADTTVLPSGIVMHTLDHGEQPVTRLSIDWPVGLADVDSPVALTLMSQLLTEGTTSRTGEEISRTLDYYGAWVKVDVELHFTTLSLFMLNKSADHVLPVVIDMITNSTFGVPEFESARRRLAATAEVNAMKVATVAEMIDRRRLFGDDTKLNDTNSADIIEAATREDVCRIYDRVARNTKPIIWVAGKCGGIIKGLVEHINAIEFSDKGYAQTVRPFIDLAPGAVTSTVNGSLQSAITISIPTIDRSHPDYIDLRLGVMALGGYFGSRLMSNLREDKGYTYGVSAALYGYREGGVAAINTQVDPAYTEDALRQIDIEIDRLCREPMPADELEMLRSHARTTLAAILDSPFSIMDMHITHEHSLTPDRYFELQWQSIQELTPQRLQQVFKRHVTSQPRLITIVGPQ